ncbi:MAG TPA: PQQ-dependent sugar dehydrogenase [Myxococcaceae bacterium]|nr:PQQ-dependent sugar dehydrogenase [Myxococcaceae bacterium]
MRARLLPLLLLATTLGCAGCPRPQSAPAPTPGPDATGADSGEDVRSDGGNADIRAACTLMPEGQYGPTGRVAVRTEVVAKGLEVPWSLAWLPDGTMLLTERPGRLRRVSPEGVLDPEPVAVVPSLATGEGGLMGLALDPDFASNRRLYLYLTSNAGGQTRNRIERWTLSPGWEARLDRVIVDDIPAATSHDGGRLRFGEDGFLYAATGDARDPALSRDPRSPAGKLLRLTTDGAPAPGNPTPESPVYLLGLRNLQAFDWLGEGRMVVADHGPSGEFGRRAHDEVSVVKAGDDLGWPEQHACETVEGTVRPALVFASAAPPGGLAIYQGEAIEAWKGSVLVATLGSRNLLRLVFEGPALVEHEVYFQDTHGRLRDAVMGPDGHLYLTTSNCDGRGSCGPEGDVILRVLPAG